MHRQNNCFLIGNLGSDPVERARNDKTGPIVGFTVAENVQTFDQETRQYKTVHTNWFNVTAFGSLAERTQNNVRKGDRVAIQGRMKVSKFTDKSGQERNSFEIIAEEVAHWKSLPSSAGVGKTLPSTEERRGKKSPSAGAGGFDDDDSLPF